MVVFFVMGVVAAASVGVYRAQLGVSDSYSYYAAFSNLKLAMGELIAVGTIHNAAAVPPADLVMDVMLPDAANRTYVAAFSDLKHKDTYNGLCQRFTEIVNVVGAVDCTKTRATSPFASTDANFIVSNGVRYFNFGRDPVPPDPADPTHLNDYYTIYVDINGELGSGISGLYSNNSVDVVPFIVLRTGQVIPGLDSANLGPSKSYLKASVKYNDGVSDIWLEKSVAYLDAACHAGIVVAPYCPAAALPIADECCNTATCAAGKYPCEVIINKP